ncbi:MAG: T9SS type A sorting domain-containing protein [Ignavibacteria bacterium]|nr:T9SS type A sorting domain-containing protein [Ignavibacteria bacterium]
MRKQIVTFFVFIALFTMSNYAQQWTYEGAFPPPPDTLKTNTGVQFVTVDPDGKVWIAPFRTFVDSVFVPDSGKYKVVRPLYVYNPDGTPWDTIRAVTIGSVFYPLYNSKYGLDKDQNGNILTCDFDNLFRINYQTGEGMNVVVPQFNQAICSPAVSDNGDIYIAQVFPGYPLRIFNSDFTFRENVVDTLENFGRYTEVSADGNTVYAARFGAKKVIVYSRPDEFSPWEVDSVLIGAVVESGTWDPVNGNIWFSSGSYFDPPLNGLTPSMWYSFNPETWAVQDSVGWVFLNAPTLTDSANQRPRGIAFSNDGTDMYVACFGASNFPPVQRFNNPAHTVGVRPDPNVVVTDYTLAQNYPNPFNPTTDIKFTVAKEGFVTLKVYDLLGKEVTTLVDQQMPSGGYTADFDASNLASGTYIYTLSVNGVSISKKMMLLK